MNKEITQTSVLEEFSVVELEQRVEFGLCGGGGGGPGDGGGGGGGPGDEDGCLGGYDTCEEQ